MSRVVPWAELVALVAPFAPEGRRCGTPSAVATMLRIDFMRQWFGLSDPAMEEALHDVPQYREFAGLDSWTTGLARESTILRFRHLLEKQKLADQRLVLINGGLGDKGLMLRAGTVVDATLKGFFGSSASHRRTASPNRAGQAAGKLTWQLESRGAHRRVC